MMSSRTTILIVDDEEDAAAITAATLEGAGYDVVIARSGREAVNLLFAMSALPAVIVLDIYMPGMDGRDVARVIRSYSRLAAIPIILHSAYEADWGALRLAQAFVPKRDTCAELPAVVQSYARRASG